MSRILETNFTIYTGVQAEFQGVCLSRDSLLSGKRRLLTFCVRNRRFNAVLMETANCYELYSKLPMAPMNVSSFHHCTIVSYRDEIRWNAA